MREDGILVTVLLLDDDDELPSSPTEGEMALTTQLGADRLREIDATLRRHAGGSWLKVARVVFESLQAGGFSAADDGHVALHVRRLIGIVDSGVLEARGNVRRPRRSEVRHASSSSE